MKKIGLTPWRKKTRVYTATMMANQVLFCFFLNSLSKYIVQFLVSQKIEQLCVGWPIAEVPLRRIAYKGNVP